MSVEIWLAKGKKEGFFQKNGWMDVQRVTTVFGARAALRRPGLSPALDAFHPLRRVRVHHETERSRFFEIVS